MKDGVPEIEGHRLIVVTGEDGFDRLAFVVRRG